MDKILITGGTGMVGKAIKEIVKDNSSYHFSYSHDCLLYTSPSPRDS